MRVADNYFGCAFGYLFEILLLDRDTGRGQIWRPRAKACRKWSTTSTAVACGLLLANCKAEWNEDPIRAAGPEREGSFPSLDMAN